MKVLIVEDSRHFREYLRTVAEHMGHETRQAADGLEGLSLFKDFAPDLVLTDIQMPNMNGLELLGEIRKENTDAIVVMMTAFDSSDFAMQALRLHAQNYLRKPFSYDEYRGLLQKYEMVVQSRTLDRAVMGMIVRRELTMKIDNRIELLPKIVDRLMQETADAVRREEWLGVHLGLTELLMNAIEHGNLEITFEEKRAAMAASPDGWEKLYQRRLADPVLAGRWTTVDFKLDAQGCEWYIQDEGTGFDWKSLPNPLEDENPYEPLGRGIFI
ncbi:MAG: response regulator, partial [Thermodesulfobacteriota bacterium]